MEINFSAIQKIQDDDGDIQKDDFMKFCTDNRLLDFGNVMAIAGAEARWIFFISNQFNQSISDLGIFRQ